ncbi:hypothetical protein Pan44_55340 [Caulifigura coniformis]|uniref:Uncharacterized protein n=1 Tax=Caulifigura coniformis TaxID=2527983 RepID=A0A517SMX0_9PLAN|nr:hypothetical protein [Caulifigura coniformis]QDT57465.1 hypothetical protein Pan44_55340 [Caulifigura coniformis]
MSESIAKLLESLLSQIPGRTPESEARLAELCRQLRELQQTDGNLTVTPAPEPDPLTAPDARTVEAAPTGSAMSRDDEEILEAIQAEIESLSALIQSTQGGPSRSGG